MGTEIKSNQLDVLEWDGEYLSSINLTGNHNNNNNRNQLELKMEREKTK